MFCHGFEPACGEIDVGSYAEVCAVDMTVCFTENMRRSPCCPLCGREVAWIGSHCADHEVQTGFGECQLMAEPVGRHSRICIGIGQPDPTVVDVRKPAEASLDTRGQQRRADPAARAAPTRRAAILVTWNGERRAISADLSSQESRTSMTSTSTLHPGLDVTRSTAAFSAARQRGSKRSSFWIGTTTRMASIDAPFIRRVPSVGPRTGRADGRRLPEENRPRCGARGRLSRSDL